MWVGASTMRATEESEEERADVGGRVDDAGDGGVRGGAGRCVLMCSEILL